MLFLKVLCVLTCSNLFRLIHSLGASAYLLHDELMVVNSTKLHIKARRAAPLSFTECMPNSDYSTVVVIVVVGGCNVLKVRKQQTVAAV